MRKLLLVLAIIASASLPVLSAMADPPTEPPGQGECEHGNSGQECREDPNENGQDCLEHGNSGGVNEDHCISPPPPTSPPPTPTDPPPCDQDECPPPTSPPPTSTDPPTCDQDECPPTSPPPTPTDPPTTVPPAPTCEPSVGFSRWYADPMIDITLEGPATFRIRGGVQRSQHSDTGQDIKVFRVTLACDQTLVIDHYKVKRGHFLFVYVNGVLFERVLPPVFN